jgi:hypothetical protein
MSRIINTAFIAFVLGGATLAASGVPARADNVTVGVVPGGIAFGYSDGYWDRERHWHDWRDHQEAERFRAADRAHYYERRHDADEHDRDHGWRDNDRYWEHH